MMNLMMSALQGEACSVKSDRGIDISHTKLGGKYDIKINESVVLDVGAGLQYADLQAHFRFEEYEGGTAGTGTEITRLSLRIAELDLIWKLVWELT